MSEPQKLYAVRKKHQYGHYGGLLVHDGSWKQFKAYKRIRGVLQAVSGVFILLMFQVTSSKVSEDQITVQKLLVTCDRVKPEGIA